MQDLWTGVWRITVLVMLMGIAYEGGRIRADLAARLVELEQYRSQHTSDVSPVVSRINALEALSSRTAAQIEARQEATDRIERALERIDTSLRAHSDGDRK